MPAARVINEAREEELEDFMNVDAIVLDDEDVVMHSDSDSSEVDDDSDEFYRFQFIQYDRSNPNNWPSLVSFRKQFIDSLIESLKDYYGGDDIDEFEILNVKSLQINDGEIDFPQNHQRKHDHLAKRFQINSPNIGLQFEDLLKNVLTRVTDATFKEWLSKPPQIFYAKVLETADNDELIDLSDELFDYIASALTVPVGSVDAERGFSILFHSLDSRRSRLRISTIDDILQIRLNAPPPHFTIRLL